jgi:hypothetical protein
MPMNIVARAALSRRRVLSVFAVALTVPALPALAAKDSAKDLPQFPRTLSAQRQLRRRRQASLLASVKTVRSYFTVGLASLIIDDRTSSAKRGEPPALMAIHSSDARIGISRILRSR